MWYQGFATRLFIAFELLSSNISSRNHNFYWWILSSVNSISVLSIRTLFPWLHSLVQTEEGLGEFKTVMQTDGHLCMWNDRIRCDSCQNVLHMIQKDVMFSFAASMVYTRNAQDLPFGSQEWLAFFELLCKIFVLSSVTMDGNDYYLIAGNLPPTPIHQPQLYQSVWLISWCS